jgi:hypothetical protein
MIVSSLLVQATTVVLAVFNAIQILPTALIVASIAMIIISRKWLTSTMKWAIIRGTARHVIHVTLREWPEIDKMKNNEKTESTNH